MSASRFDRAPGSRVLLPAPPTPIIGRDQDLAITRSMLLDRGVRVLTLTGPGGVGKSRLALELAHGIVDRFPDGVWWIDLAHIRDVAHVPSAVSSALRFEAAHAPPTLATFIEELRHRHALLVVDNTEQIAGMGEVVARLVAACPRLSVVATGRSPLGVRAEQRYALESLAVTVSGDNRLDGDAALAPAVELFAVTARSVAPTLRFSSSDLNLAADICSRVDGLPLAIEIVASQAHLLSLPEMLEQLDHRLPLALPGRMDLPPRQQTLDSTIAWSYAQLPPALQVAFTRLAVFAGGFSLDAAAAMLCWSDRSGDTGNLMTHIGGLVDRSLLTREGNDLSRFRMLRLVRAYALERLADDPEQACVCRCHASYFRSFVQQAEAGMAGPDATTWLERLQVDHDNIHAALGWLLEMGEIRAAAQLAIDLGRYWYVRGHLREGRRWFERVLAALDLEPTRERVGVLISLGALAGALGDAEEEARHADAALALARILGDAPSLAKALSRRGSVARGQGTMLEAERYYEEALACFRLLGDHTGAAAVLNNLGLVAVHRGDTHRARAWLEESYSACERTGNQRGMAIALCNLGQRVAETDGNRSALDHYQQALCLFRMVGDTTGIAWSLQALAELAAEEGETTQAAQLYGAAEAHRESIGWRFSALEQSEYERCRNALRNHMGEDVFHVAMTAGRDLTAERVGALVVPRLASRIDLTANARVPGPAGLTPREVQVLRLVAEGLTNGEIAHHLSVSPHIVDAHLRRIYRKLEVRSRSAASRLAVEHALI